MTDPRPTHTAPPEGATVPGARLESAGRGLWMLYGVSVVLLFSAFGLALHDMANSNRPHELDKTPLVVGVLSLNLVACFTLLVRGRRALRAHHGQRHAALLRVAAVVVVLHVVFSAFAWLIAVDTLIMWLGGE